MSPARAAGPREPPSGRRKPGKAGTLLTYTQPTRGPPNVAYDHVNDKYFGTSDVLEPVPVAPGPIARRAPPSWPKCDERPADPPPPEPREFEYRPGPVRHDVTPEVLGFDDEDKGGSPGTAVQLAALGPQNFHLDLHAQTTFFAPPDYRRHTAFGTECFEQDLDLPFGGVALVDLARHGDVLADAYLEVRLPALGVAGRWVDAIGYVLWTRIRVILDDVVLHDHERLWYDLVDKLYMPFGRKAAIDAMIGRGTTLSTLEEHVVHVPLKFFWCRGHQGAAQVLPLTALPTTSRLTLEFTTETLARCVVLAAPLPAGAPARLAAKLLTHQASVEQDEQRALKQASHVIMYETCQDVDALSYQYDDGGTYDKASATVDLSELNLPVRALAFVVYDENAAASGAYFDYLDCIDDAVLYINSTERFAPRRASYFSLVQTHQHATRCTADHVHLYSFALDAADRHPSGALNFAVLDRPTLRVTFKNSQGRRLKVKVFAHCAAWLRLERGSASQLLV